MVGGQARESYQRIICRLPANHYRLAGWALCPYVAELEVQDECTRVYSHPGLLLSGFTSSRSPAVDG